MKIPRTLLPHVLLCAGVLLSAPVAAQPVPPSTILEPQLDPQVEPYAEPAAPDNDPRWAWDDLDRSGSRVATSEQARRLEQALERYRDMERRGGWNKVPTDLVMGPPYSYDCARIEALERRLLREGYLRHASTPPPLPPPARGQPPRAQPPVIRQCAYGPTLTDAVRAFQRDRKILGDGQVGALTYAQLNRPVEEIVNILERDVERWRYVSLHPSGTYLLVNIPFFDLIAYEGGREVMRTPVVVGLPTWQTPLFSDEVEYIIVNPDWGIPDSIAKQEIWPLARRDPNYLRREGITATGTNLRQKPGPKNPLGRVKFMMPNHHNVYLHDTPGKRAFTSAVRALSHGCIRLGDPVDLAKYLLRDDPQWNPRRLEAAIASGKTQQINLQQHMPVHIIYSTSRVNDDGRVEIRPDVYGMNKKPARVESLPSPVDASLQTWP